MPDAQGEAAPQEERDVERTENSSLWREYGYLSELYKFYLELVVKASGGYFLVVGGILTIVLANARKQPIIAWALLVPVLMSVLLAWASWKARKKVEELRFAIDKVAQSMDVALKPHVEILQWAVNGSSLLLFIAALLLIGLFLWLVLGT